MIASPISLPIFGEGFTINPPSFFTIFGFPIFIYAVCVVVGYLLAGLYIYKRRDTLGLTSDNVFDLVFLAVIFGIIGARAYYIIFNPSHYFGAGNWGNIIRIRSGGLAIYGGIIGSAFAFILYSKRKKIPIGKLLDAAAFGLFIGQIVGRWGNFFNREAYGIVTDLPWRMGIMTHQGFQYVHPIFLYEALWNCIGLILLHVYSKNRKSGYPGQFFIMYVAWYGFGRFFIEGIRGPDALLIHGTDIRVSQVLAALSCIVAIALFVYFMHKNHGLSLSSDGSSQKHGSTDNVRESKTTNTKQIRAINIAKGRRAANEQSIEKARNAVKTRRMSEIRRIRRAEK